jgi:hypothetical protein
MSSPRFATLLTLTPGPISTSKRVTVGPREERATFALIPNWSNVSCSAFVWAAIARDGSPPSARPLLSRSSGGSS